MFIYVIVCNESLKLYVGQHKGNSLQKYLQTKLSDAKHHRGGSSHLFNAMRMHPKAAWSIHSLISDLQTREECDHWEKTLIKALKTQHPDVGYNICRGGEGFTGPHTEEWKQKTSARMMGHSVSEETRAKLVVAITGKKASPETKAKLSTSHLGNSSARGAVRSPEYIANMSARMRSQKPYERTPEVLAKQSAAHKGKPNGLLGYKHSEATRERMSEAAKKREAKKLRMGAKK